MATHATGSIRRITGALAARLALHFAPADAAVYASGPCADVCPVLAAYVDGISASPALAPVASLYAARLASTRASAPEAARRAATLVDITARALAPAALERAGLAAPALELRSLGEVRDESSSAAAYLALAHAAAETLAAGTVDLAVAFEVAGALRAAAEAAHDLAAGPYIEEAARLSALAASRLAQVAAADAQSSVSAALDLATASPFSVC